MNYNTNQLVNEIVTACGGSKQINPGQLYSELSQLSNGEIKKAFATMATMISELSLQNKTAEYKVPKNGEPVDITSMVTISTAHITPEIAFDLMREPKENNLGLSVYPKAGYGWMVYVPEYITENKKEDSSLWLALNYARQQHCDWLCLDSDGPIMDDLPTYDWEGNEEHRYDLDSEEPTLD